MPFRHILVPVDFGEPSDGAVDVALTMALEFDSKVTLLHVAWMPPYYYSAYAEGLAYPMDEIETRAKAELDKAVAKAQARYPRVEGVLLSGQPWEQILEAIRQSHADLVVMGTHGRRGLSRVFLGSVAEKIVRHSPVPVLTTAGYREPEHRDER